MTDDDALIQEHQEEVKKAVNERKVVFKGEVMAGQETAEEAQENPGAVASVGEMDEMFFVYQGRDEREPHSFIKRDPLFQQGIVSS